MWKRAITAVAMILAVGACSDDNGTEPDFNDDDDGSNTQMGMVEGRIEQGSSGGGPAAASSIEASSVSVAQLSADGSTEVLAEAQVAADGTYTVDDVPASRTDLVVIAEAGGEETGRVLLHGESRSGITMTAQPMNFETSVESEIYTRARSMGRSAESSAEIALMVRMDEDAASTAMSSEANVDAVAEAFIQANESFVAAIAASGDVELDARERSEVIVQAAQEFAAQVDAGTTATAARGQFVRASADAWANAGVTAELVAEATATAVTVMDDMTASLDSNVRGDASLGATLLNIEARSRMAGNVESSSTAGANEGVLDALTTAQTELSVDADLAFLSNVYADLSTEAQAAIMTALTSSTAEATIAQQLAVETAAQGAFEAANLSAKLEGAANASAMAQVVFGAAGGRHQPC